MHKEMNGGFFDDFCLQHFQAQRSDRLVMLARRIVTKQLIILLLRGKKILLRILICSLYIIVYDIVCMSIYLKMLVWIIIIVLYYYGDGAT